MGDEDSDFLLLQWRVSARGIPVQDPRTDCSAGERERLTRGEARRTNAVGDLAGYLLLGDRRREEI